MSTPASHSWMLWTEVSPKVHFNDVAFSPFLLCLDVEWIHARFQSDIRSVRNRVPQICLLSVLV